MKNKLTRIRRKREEKGLRTPSVVVAVGFFSKIVWTPAGRVEFFVLFFIHIGSRRVHIAGMTAHPDDAWIAQQARHVAQVFAEQPHQPRFLIRDYDSKFTPEFDAILESTGVEVIPVGPRAPNLNAYAERWVESIKYECLNHFIVLGEAHLSYLVNEYTDFYNTFRPHQGVGNRPLTDMLTPPPLTIFDPEDIVCEERLGGLLKHYRRAG